MESWYVRLFCVRCGSPVCAIRDPEFVEPASVYTYECHECGYCGLLSRPAEHPLDDTDARG
jgi:hypothetical protein